MTKPALSFLLLATMFLTAVSLAQAQPGGKIPTIGFLFSGAPAESLPRIEAFRQGLRELGYVEARNIVIEQRSSDGKPDNLSSLAAELVGLKVAVLVTMGSNVTQAAKNVTGTIPLS
jgi:ABC-type uncharacterized transport system substrate-binding protein